MPRDLLPSKSPPILTASPEIQTPDRSDSFEDMDTSNTTGLDFQMYSAESDDKDRDVSDMLRRADEKDQLHPYVSTLTLADIDACVALENSAFPENERCSREKFEYRLTACPSLSLGLFSSTSREPDEETRPLHEASRAPDSTNPSHKAILLGHVFATLTTADSVTDASMGLPETFRSHREVKPGDHASTTEDNKPPAVPKKEHPSISSNSGVPSADQAEAASGHHPLGRTLAIHSVCIVPPYQHLGLGKILLHSYLQRIEGSGIADTAALLAHDEVTEWYVSCFGFTQKGKSNVKFGGGQWNDLRYEFTESGLWS